MSQSEGPKRGLFCIPRYQTLFKELSVASNVASEHSTGPPAPGATLLHMGHAPLGLPGECSRAGTKPCTAECPSHGPLLPLARWISRKEGSAWFRAASPWCLGLCPVMGLVEQAAPSSPVLEEFSSAGLQCVSGPCFPVQGELVWNKPLRPACWGFSIVTAHSAPCPAGWAVGLSGVPSAPAAPRRPPQCWG